MLVSFHSSLYVDMMDCMRNFKVEVSELIMWRRKFGEYASSYNSLVDAYNDQSEEVTWLKAKVADIEDRSCKNYVKIWGIPEAKQPAQLQKYARDLMKA